MAPSPDGTFRPQRVSDGAVPAVAVAAPAPVVAVLCKDCGRSGRVAAGRDPVCPDCRTWRKAKRFALAVGLEAVRYGLVRLNLWAATRNGGGDVGRP